jgi:hypothetical protein
MPVVFICISASLSVKCAWHCCLLYPCQQLQMVVEAALEIAGPRAAQKCLQLCRLHPFAGIQSLSDTHAITTVAAVTAVYITTTQLHPLSYTHTFTLREHRHLTALLLLPPLLLLLLLQMAYHISSGIPRLLCGDAQRLQQVGDVICC